ncbi:MAG: glycosyltransferase family 2 protein [bacterium]|nr:MAG: glycosyltransferase family 2 protein [bacterium]
MNERQLHVIVLNWNGERVIEACLRSLHAVRGIPLRIIVVDNASTDASPEIVKRLFPETELIRNDGNLMYAEGNNVGLRRAMEDGGELFLLLNNDTEVDPDFAVRMLEILEKRPDVGIVGPKIFYYDDPKRIWYGGGDFYPFVWIPRHRNIRKLDGTFEESGGETGYVSGCALLVRREVIEEIGLLDPGYFIYCEDVDFCLRAFRAGWRCFYEPSAKVWHKVSSSSGGGLTPFKLENRLVSTFRLFVRFRPLWWRIFLAPAHAGGFLVLSFALLAMGRWGLLRGAWRGATRILKSA